MTVEEMQARVRLFVKAGKRSAKFQDVEIEDIRFLKFKTITAVKDALEAGDEKEVIKAVFEDQGKEYTQEETKEKAEFLMFIRDGLQGIANMESEAFKGDDSSSGVDMSGLEKLKELNVIDAVAGGDALKWESVNNLPYWSVFLKMLKTHEENKIERAMQKQTK